MPRTWRTGRKNPYPTTMGTMGKILPRPTIDIPYTIRLSRGERLQRVARAKRLFKAKQLKKQWIDRWNQSQTNWRTTYPSDQDHLHLSALERLAAKKDRLMRARSQKHQLLSRIAQERLARQTRAKRQQMLWRMKHKEIIDGQRKRWSHPRQGLGSHGHYLNHIRQREYHNNVIYPKMLQEEQRRKEKQQQEQQSWKNARNQHLYPNVMIGFQ